LKYFIFRDDKGHFLNDLSSHFILHDSSSTSSNFFFKISFFTLAQPVQRFEGCALSA